MSIDMGQVNQLARDLGQAGGRVGQQAARGVRRSGQQLKQAAEGLAPVRTGALRGSIGLTGSGDGRSSSMSATVTAAAPYAGYVEYGTSRMAPQPFMGPALDSVEGSFVDAMEQAAERSMLP